MGGVRSQLAPEALRQIDGSRALIERVVPEERPTYGVNTGFGRARRRAHRRRAGRRAPAEPRAQPRVRRRRAVPGRGRAGGDRCCARTRSRKGTSGVRRELVQLLVDMLAAGVLPGRALARIARRERRSRAARAPRARPRRRGRGARIGGETMAGRRRAGAGRPRADRARREGGPRAHQRHAVHGGDRRARRVPRAPAGRSWPTSRRRRRSRPCAGRGRRSRPSSRRCGRTPARSPRPRTCTGSSTTRRSWRRTAGAAACRTRTRCAARRRCTAPSATRSTTPSGWSPSS